VGTNRMSSYFVALGAPFSSDKAWNKPDSVVIKREKESDKEITENRCNQVR
jgi:hypothetical protein